MRLDRVEIMNFRSVECVTIPFDPACRVLVGVNEAGKTNILRALALLDPTQDLDGNDIREGSPHEPTTSDSWVRFVFRFDSADRTRHAEEARLGVSHPDNAVVTTSKGKISIQTITEHVEEGIYVANLRTRKRYTASWNFPSDWKMEDGWYCPVDKCPDDVMVLAGDDQIQLNTVSLVRNDDNAIGKDYLKPATLEDVHRLTRETIQVTIQRELPSCIFWKYSDDNLLPGRINLEAFKQQPESCVPLLNMFELAEMADVTSAISEALDRQNGLRNLLNRVATKATRHMRRVWRECGELKIDLNVNGDFIEATIRDRYNLYDLSRRSDGFRRFFTFLLMISAKAKAKKLSNALLIYDEPDASLHPSGARHVRDELIRISADNFVIFSTHSPFMVDTRRVDRHLIITKKNEKTEVIAVSASNITDEEVIYNALGWSSFEWLRTMNIVFEGWKDKQLFRVALEGAPATRKELKQFFASVGTCHAQGVKDVGRVAPLFELANRECVILTDGDKPAKERQAKYDGYGKWIRYDELVSDKAIVTAEDFLTNEHLIESLRETLTERAGSPPPTGDAFRSIDGKLAGLRKWLERGGLTNEDIRRTVDRFKERAFETLAASDIDPCYFGMLNALRHRMGSTASVLRLKARADTGASADGEGQQDSPALDRERSEK